MTDRLIRDMRTQAVRCRGLAAGYSQAGETGLKSAALNAAVMLEDAAKFLAEFDAAHKVIKEVPEL